MSVRTPPHGSLPCPCTSSHRCGEQLFDAESVDGHQVHMSNAQVRACTYTYVRPGSYGHQVLRQEEKDAKSAAQLHLLHSCLGTPTEQVSVLYSLPCMCTQCMPTVHVTCIIYTYFIAYYLQPAGRTSST